MEKCSSEENETMHVMLVWNENHTEKVIDGKGKSEKLCSFVLPYISYPHVYYPRRLTLCYFVSVNFCV